MNEVVMNEVVVNEVALKSNKRRLNFVLSKIAELQAEQRSLEVAEEAFEASRSRNVTKRSKGRPQAKKEVAEEVDLFANLVKEVVSSSSECAVSEGAVAEEKPVAKKEKVSKPPAEKKEKKEKVLKHVLSEEEKAVKKAELDKAKAEEKLEKAALKKLQLEADKLNKAEEKKAQLAADKVLKAAEKAAAIAAEKESKKQALEAEKQAKKVTLEQEKQDKANAKKLALLEAKYAKEQAKEQAKAEKAPKAAPKKAAAPKEEVVVSEPVEKVTVSRITINDIKYLKSSTNILYNPDTREEVGLYDPETKMIKPLPDDEEEEMTEDAYESDNE